MKPRPRRITRALGYACIGLAVVTTAAWLASGWYGAAYGWGGRRALSIGAGWIEYDGPGTADAFGQADGWQCWSRTIGSQWRFDFLHVSNAAQTVVGVPLYPIPLLLGALGFTILHRTRPRPPYLCPKCKYDLRGLPPAAPCPECAAPARA